MNKTAVQYLLKWLLAPTLLIVLLWLIYKQLLQSGDLWLQWEQLQSYFLNSSKIWLVVVVLLAPCNWLVESFKWRLLNANMYRLSLWQSFCSVLTGISFAMITPGKVGEFAGRMLHFPNDYKIKASIATFMSNIIQSLATTFWGIIGLLYYCIQYPSRWNIFFFIAVSMLGIIGLIAYKFRTQLLRSAKRYKWFHKVSNILQALSIAQPRLLVQLFILSCLRFLIYNIQFLILANLLGAQLEWFEGLMITFLMFWMIAIVPSFLIADIGVRGFIAGLLFVQSGISQNAIAILGASYVIWLINLVMPAIFGSLFVLKTGKYFKSSKIE